MKKELLLVAFIGAALVTNAQVKVGDNPTTINSNSVLEIESTNKGVLMPRVMLTSIHDVTTVLAPTNSLMVYNTASSALADYREDVTPGYYFYSTAETKWVKLITSSLQDLRKLGRNHISSDAGFGSTGTYLGTGFGQDNIAIGDQSLNASIKVDGNTAIGSNSMALLQTGKYNTGIGRNTLKTIATGEGNTAIGWNSLTTIGSGAHNLAIGVQSLAIMTTGNYNIALGWQAGGATLNGDFNLFLGTRAGNNYSGNNRLMIDNTATGTNTPLIDGDFATKILKINNTLQVADLASAAIATTGNRPVVADANGQLMIGTAAAAGGATTADNGLTKTADNIQLGGALIKPTTISTDATNNLVVNATGIGGNNVELNQGVNVLATSINSSTAKAIALRGRVSQTTGAIGQARGVSGAANITGGDIAGTATGGYFNTAIGGTTLPATNGLMTGVAADAEALGSNTNSASSTFAGARFGADVTAAPTTHSAGVIATAVGSTASNVGIAASSTTDAATLTTAINALPANSSAAIYGLNPLPATAGGVATNNNAIVSSGGVQLTNLGTTAATKMVGIDALGNLSTTTLTAASADNGLSIGTGANAGKVILGGTLNIPTAIATTDVNNLVVNATGIGGNNVELNQGVNVLATSINSSTAKAVALRGRVSQTTGAIGQARGVSGAANITGGNVAGTATGGYFNTAIGGTTLPATNGLMTGVAADAEALGSNTNSASSTFAGARFGADVTAAPTTHSAGVVATAVGSSTSNVGIAASATTDAATLTGMVNALPAGTNAATYSYAPAGASNFASYSDGNVAMKNLPTTGSTALLGIDANGNVSTTAAALPADLRLVGTGNHISQDAGVGSNGTSAGTGYSNIIVGNGNINYPAAGNSMTTGYRNIFLGETVGNANTAGYRNTIVGAPSFTANTTGHENTAFGNSTLRFSNGDFNTVVGTYTMNQNRSGSENTAIGANALYENTTGQKNTALGWRALGGAKDGSSNIGVGYNTGINVGGSNNIIIGNSLDIQNTAASNQLNIGNLIYATGVDGSGATLSTGNVGIGKKAPNSRLAVVGLPVFADNTTALAGSLTAGDFYRTATGVVMVVF